MDSRAYLQTLQGNLLRPDNFKSLELTREWAKRFPNKPAVYAFKHFNDLVYVGETGNLRGRMLDLLDSRHHTIRRTLGIKNFSRLEGFIKATNRIKFPDNIEELLNAHIIREFKIAFLEVSLGRKELEELIEHQIDKDLKLNKRGRRKN